MQDNTVVGKTGCEDDKRLNYFIIVYRIGFCRLKDFATKELVIFFFLNVRAASLTGKCAPYMEGNGFESRARAC